MVIAADGLQQHAGDDEYHLERDQHRDKREESPEERDPVRYRRDRDHVTEANIPLAPYELTGEDRDEERHHRGKRTAQHRARDEMGDRPGERAESASADVPTVAEDEQEGADEHE